MKDVRVKVDPEAAASIHEDGIVILHIGNGRVYAANKAGARIWRGIAQEQPFNTIATEISDEYQIPITAVREHVSAFMSDLERHSLIQRQENS
jgi:Coenzyme PQQ synthesis protein D (PqqD)